MRDEGNLKSSGEMNEEGRSDWRHGAPAFGDGTVLLSLRMPIGTFRTAGTGLFPLILGVFLMILSAAFLLNLFLKRNKESGKKGLGTETPGSARTLILFVPCKGQAGCRRAVQDPMVGDDLERSPSSINQVLRQEDTSSDPGRQHPRAPENGTQENPVRNPLIVPSRRAILGSISFPVR